MQFSRQAEDCRTPVLGEKILGWIPSTALVLFLCAPFFYIWIKVAGLSQQRNANRFAGSWYNIGSQGSGNDRLDRSSVYKNSKLGAREDGNLFPNGTFEPQTCHYIDVQYILGRLQKKRLCRPEV